MTQTFNSYVLDTLAIIVNWTNEDGTAKDLTGGSVVAFASSGGVTYELTAVILDATAGQVRISSDPGDLPAGLYQVQTRATVSGITQTYALQVPVRASLVAA